MRIRITPLEERIVLDAAGARDIVHSHHSEAAIAAALAHHRDAGIALVVPPGQERSAEKNFDEKSNSIDHHTTNAIHHDPLAANGVNVLVVSSRIQNPMALVNAVNSNTRVVYYNQATTTLQQLSQDIINVLHGSKANNIAFANDGAGGEFSLTQNIVVSASSLQSNAALQMFWQNIGAHVAKGGHIDLLACDVASTQQGLNVVSELSTIVNASSTNLHIQVDASTDRTANHAQGGNFFLEVGNINAQKVYFNAQKLALWTGALDNAQVPQLAPGATPVGIMSGLVDVNGTTYFTLYAEGASLLEKYTPNGPVSLHAFSLIDGYNSPP